MTKGDKVVLYGIVDEMLDDGACQRRVIVQLPSGKNALVKESDIGFVFGRAMNVDPFARWATNYDEAAKVKVEEVDLPTIVEESNDGSQSAEHDVPLRNGDH